METLHDLFALFFGRGAAPALIYRTGVRRQVISYGQLHDLSLRMAGLLAARGVCPGDRVLLWAPNSPWWVVSFWGAVLRGAVVVPADFMAGAERVENIAGLAGAVLMIRSRMKPLDVASAPALVIEELPFLLDRTAPASPVPVRAESMAELVYTSGTTGSPKGVVLSHRNLLANLLQVNTHLPIVHSRYVFLSVLPLSHMFEQMAGLLTPLYTGAAIAYPRVLKPSALREAFREEDIHGVICVPRLLQLLKSGIEDELAAKGLSAPFHWCMDHAGRFPDWLRRFLFWPVRHRFGRHFVLFVAGGAPLAPELFRFWQTLDMPVVEGYGLTECSPVLAAHTLESRRPGFVGCPLPGVAVRIQEGEVQVRGANVFGGYYGNESATRAAFTTDGWFRTGDLGRLEEDGCLCILGRSKELIVTGAGVNVYPDELERVLDGLDGVRESCVIGMDSGSGEEVHAVLLLDGSGRSPAEIIAAANGQLDPLQRISGWTLWPEAEFPKTTTLKIRKFIVRERLGQDVAPAGQIPTDPLIALLARISGSPVRDIADGALLVSDVGLTSIGRLELVTCLEREYRCDLDEASITELTTVGDLRRLLAGHRGAERRNRFRFWTNLGLFRLVRRLADAMLHDPLLRLLAPVRVIGQDQLQTVTAPVMFVANHLSYLDQPVIMAALPGTWRYRTATAAWEEFFFVNFRGWPGRIWKRLTYEYGTLLLNLFPLSQTSGFRESLAFMGRLADRGCNILLFPEGERSRDGHLLPFRRGVGIMVSELAIPVVPIHLSGVEQVLPRGASWPRRGQVIVRFGRPLHFRGEAPEEIVRLVQHAVATLAEDAG